MNKKYIRILAEVAIVLSAAGMMIGCSNESKTNSSRVEVTITTDNETTVDETTAEEEVSYEDSDLIRNDSSLNESSLNNNSETTTTKICNSENTQNNIEIISTDIIYTTVQDNYPIIVTESEPQLNAVAVEQTPVIIEETPTEIGEPITADYTPYDLYNQGRLYWGDYQYTWYSERVLPGYDLIIDGRHTDSDGFVCDGDGYICVAASSLNKGTIVDTPFGRQGKVYDSGCSWGVIDLYVNW